MPPASRRVSAIVELARTVAQTPSPANRALNRPVTSSTPCATTEGPEKAVNGSVSGGRSDKFCTKVADRWLEVDLGSNRTVSTFVVKHSGAGGEPTAYNLRDYRFETRTAGGAWSPAATVTGNTASVTTTTVAPRSARYVRLTVTAGEQANRGRSRPDLRVRGLQRRRAGRHRRGAAHRLFGPRRDRPGAALRGRRVRGGPRQSGARRRGRGALGGDRIGLPGDAVP